ncbi:uncharacterized protein LOC121375801 [Gigantopelta aegis]|uniref:uncharacterized protein LOC121375801 n=1 Tax=Gigantopelta aegis TaxID=1735272 RepID=UPI001B88E386|nr:uncharacterized protein LOC121375801 [Gigantopelta aegis]
MGCVFSVFQEVVLTRFPGKEGSMLGGKTRSKEVLVQTTPTNTINTVAKDSQRTPGHEITSLEEAVESQNTDLLQKIISQGVDVQVLHTQDKHYISPVEKACILGYTDIVKIFLDNGCSPNLPTSCGRLIHSVLEAMKTNAITAADGRQLVSLLCRSGCDVNIKNKQTATTLLQAAELGDRAILEMILSICREVQLTKQCGGSLFSPLHMSCMRGDLDCVQLLLKHSAGKHVNLCDANRNTALLLALKSMLHNLKYLNAARIDIDHNMTNQKDKDSVRFKLLKLQYNSIGIVEALLLAGADPNCIGYLRTSSYARQAEFLESSLYFALQLCALDRTGGFQDSQPCDEYTQTMKLLSLESLQGVERWTGGVTNFPMVKDEAVPSPYTGVVRLIVLSGFDLDFVSQAEIVVALKPHHADTLLLDEIYEFWNKYKLQKPPKLMHLSKQVIRIHLSHLQGLHRIDELPLPYRVKEYLKLNYL